MNKLCKRAKCLTLVKCCLCMFHNWLLFFNVSIILLYVAHFSCKVSWYVGSQVWRGFCVFSS